MSVPPLSSACVYGDESVILTLLETASLDTDLLLIAAALPSAPADPLIQWFAGPSSSTIARLRQRDLEPGVRSGEEPLVILWAFPAAVPPHARSGQAAAIESLRGIVQSVTREKAGQWGPVNGIAVRADDADGAAAALRFLGDFNGGFTAGSTLDLVSGPEVAR
jgi:hypothetical protein